MDKNNVNVEQPENSQVQGDTMSQDEVLEQSEKIGSTFGKFKDSKALFDAYNNLQSEFTKKCQMLSQLQAEQDNRQLPTFMQDDWKDKVSEFMEKNPQAKDYSDLISQTIVENKNIATSDNPLEMAWTKIIRENFKSPKNLIRDEKFVNDYILQNEDIERKIIENYFKKNSIEKAPTLISGEGGKSILTPPNRPKTLKDANLIASRLLK